jgi:hypothetical protein
MAEPRLPFRENIPMQDFIQHQVQQRLISLVQDVREMFPEAQTGHILAELAMGTTFATYQMLLLTCGSKPETDQLLRFLTDKTIKADHSAALAAIRKERP